MQTTRSSASSAVQAPQNPAVIISNKREFYDVRFPEPGEKFKMNVTIPPENNGRFFTRESWNEFLAPIKGFFGHTFQLGYEADMSFEWGSSPYLTMESMLSRFYRRVQLPHKPLVFSVGVKCVDASRLNNLFASGKKSPEKQTRYGSRICSITFTLPVTTDGNGEDLTELEFTAWLMEYYSPIPEDGGGGHTKHYNLITPWF